MKRWHRYDRRLERVLAAEHLQLVVLREDGEQRAEGPVVAREAGEEAVRKNPARRRDPGPIGKRLSVADPVVPGVVEDLAVAGLVTRRSRSDLPEPRRRWAGPPERVDDQVGTEISLLRARTLDSPGLAKKPDEARVRQELDLRLREHGLA